MGSATRHRKAFLREHKICAFCGGDAPSTTIEHCPPRALFQDRHWPEGFEFPSCDQCNHGTSDHDLIVAVLGRIDPMRESGNSDGRLPGLMKQFNRQYPDLFRKMMPSPTEARQQNRELGLQPESGQTQQETGIVKITPEIHRAVLSLGRKLAKGVFYNETGNPFPNEGCLLMNWFTNTDLLRDGKYVVLDVLKSLVGSAPALQRTGKFLNDQFEYKLSISAEKEWFILQAAFGNSFGFVVFGSSLPGQLEEKVEAMREQLSQRGPFSVLQSPYLT